MTIYRYQIPPHVIGNPFALELPSGATILDAGLSSKDLSDSTGFAIWAMVDPKNKYVEKSFVMHYTGDRVKSPTLLTHIKTFSEAGTVFHLFEMA